ncbi:MAG: hypothetical protein R3E68_19740 [Burkholderiaceae bacterium]
MRKVFAFVLVVIAAATGQPGDPPKANLAGLSCPAIESSAQVSTDACPAPAKVPDRERGSTTQPKTS